MTSSSQTTQLNDTAITNSSSTVNLLAHAQVPLPPKDDVISDPKDTEMSGNGFQHCGFSKDNGNYDGSADWTLYDDDETNDNDDYLTEDDMLDIASVKANHGSIYAGTNNRTVVQIPRGTSYDAHAISDERTAFYDPTCDAPQNSGHQEEETRAKHMYSTQEPDQTDQTVLQVWASIPERHESIACRSHQLQNSALVDQTMWPHEEDIDLEV